jgi:hypothetical protein
LEQEIQKSGNKKIQKSGKQNYKNQETNIQEQQFPKSRNKILKILGKNYRNKKIEKAEQKLQKLGNRHYKKNPRTKIREQKL